MSIKYKKAVLYLALFLFSGTVTAQIQVGAARMEAYWPLLQGKSIGMVVNQTAVVGQTHLVDSLLSLGVKVKAVFAPEHGFRGDHGAGEHVNSSVDEQTGLKIISLYGSHKKPTPEDLQGMDIVLFDIQDVGARFYTYISTLHYVMEACAEQGKQVIVLDRPNPNGHYVDGPVLDLKFKSFVGMHPVPIVHGMTVGEYAQMINGEKWLTGGVTCDLEVITAKGYDHDTFYELPIKPSPNLPNKYAIYLYPSLCLFEGTKVSVGRGTEFPFQVIGRPGFKNGSYSFTPQSIPGVAPNPPYKGEPCSGFMLRNFCDSFLKACGNLYLYWLTGFYKDATDKDQFFNKFFDKLAGTDQLRKQIEQGVSVPDIRKSWEPKLSEFKKIRKKYLLYPDFHPVTFLEGK